jgi:demethylmenaquinone methyltransferase / 2-methoxy-6-polyprenyl-1,4-benzoquinol methylase
LRRELVGGEKERYVNQLFASAASRYDLLNSVISIGRHKSWRRLAVRMSGVKTGGAALDVATGTGDFAIDLADAVGKTGHVAGVDFCEPMLKLAAEKTAGRDEINLAVANAEHLPFASDSFDCSTIGFALRNVADVRAVITEMARVTKPGGSVVSLEILGPKAKILQPLWRLYFFRLMPKIAQCFGAEREPYDYLPNSVERFCSREELAEVFRDSGLTDVKIRGLMFGIVCIHMGTKQ